MKTLTSIVAIAAALCAASCTQTQSEYDSFYDMFPKERSLTVDEEVVISRPLASVRGGLIYDSHKGGEIYDSYLIANNSDPQNRVVVININTGEVENSIMNKGNGRNEVVYGSLLSMCRDEVICYDGAKEMIWRCDFEEIFKPTAMQSWRQEKNSWEGLFMCKFNPGIIDDHRRIFCGCREEGLFEIVNPDGEAIYTFGEYQRLEGDDVERAVPYAGAFSITPSVERFLYYTSAGNILYFYDISDSGSEPKLLNKYHFDTPVYNVEYIQGGMRIMGDEESLVGTISAAVSDENFYLLNINKRQSELKSAEDWMCNTVYVFDRDGRPVEKITLDRGVAAIFYSAENNSLYSVSLNDQEEDCLIRYQL